MKIIFSNTTTEEQCTSQKAAKKLFGGDILLARSLHARINALRQAENLKDIIVQPQFRFHKLKNKNGKDLEGYFAIDVKTKTNPWRIILEPLDEDEQPYVPCNIDEIAAAVRIVEIEEVSRHYE